MSGTETNEVVDVRQIVKHGCYKKIVNRKVIGNAS